MKGAFGKVILEEAAAHQREKISLLERDSRGRGDHEGEIDQVPHAKKSEIAIQSVESPEMLIDEQPADKENDVDLVKKGRETYIPIQVQHHECMRKVHESIP